MRSDVQASIPSPSSGVLELGPFPLRAYAVCIIIGVIAAVILGDRRWVARGGRQGTVAEVATYAVPAGIIGARLYHVVTSFDLYEGRLVDTLKIWQGGLGIWGGVAGGALGAWLYTRKHGISLPPFADAVAPGIALAQAIGRFGNYFNQELFGKPTDVAWALRIDPENRPDGYADSPTFQPTFAYEVLWDLGVAGLVLWADRRFQLGRGRAFALYVAAYCAGRFWIEALRIDEANHFLGLRLNIFTSLTLFVLALAYLVLRRGTREDAHTVQVDDEWPPPADEAPEHDADEPADQAGSPDGSAHEGLTGQGPRDG